MSELKGQNVNLDASNRVDIKGRNVNINALNALYISSVTTDIHGDVIMNGKISTNSIDCVYPEGTLNIAETNASIVNIGNSINTQTLNIGTGTGLSTINIGGSSDIVNIGGNINYIQSINLQVNDATITLNKGSIGTGTARGAGIEIRDGDIDAKGYIKVDNDGTGFLFKSPENENIANFQLNNLNSGLVLCDNSLNITASNIINDDLTFKNGE